MSWITGIEENKLRGAWCVIVNTHGSTPRKIGAKMLVYENGDTEGTIGGGNLEKKVIENALRQIQENEPKFFKHDLLHQHNMCCGGSVSIYIEPIMKKDKLFIFGAGHTGSALATYASDMGFEVYIIDDREDYLKNVNAPNVNKLNFKYDKILPSLPFDDRSFITIMTYEHSYDRDILSFCINQPHAYLGMIGSQRKVELTKKLFLEGEIGTQKELEAIDMPMGIKINAQGPNEIAISILAKLITVKNDI